MDKFDAVLNEIEEAFGDAIVTSSGSWPTDVTDEDYDDLANGDLFLLDAQTMPYAIYCLMRYFLGNKNNGQMSLALETFINFIDVRDKDDDAVPFKSDNYDDVYAFKFEQLTQVTKKQSKAISSWLKLVGTWRDDYDDDNCDDDDDDFRPTAERARQYWARRSER